MATEFPTEPKQVCPTIGEHPTNILYNEYSDKNFVIVTQYKKIGSMILVSEDKTPASAQMGLKTYTCQVLLGEDTPVTQMIARRIADGTGMKKDTMVCMALKDIGKETIEAVHQSLSKLTS